MAKAKQVGKTLVASGEPRTYQATLARTLSAEEPPGVILAVAALVPAACEAFSPDELEARLIEYERRAERNLPLPLFGKPQPDVPEFVADPLREFTCWACGLVVRKKGRTCLKDPGREARAADRFVSRILPNNITETYCPKCFGIWGWPDEFNAIL